MNSDSLFHIQNLFILQLKIPSAVQEYSGQGRWLNMPRKLGISSTITEVVQLSIMNMRVPIKVINPIRRLWLKQEKDSNGKYVLTIGGNESDSVRIKEVRLDTNGKIKNRQNNPFILIIETLK
jgi:hypothetical protein